MSGTTTWPTTVRSIGWTVPADVGSDPSAPAPRTVSPIRTPSPRMTLPPKAISVLPEGSRPATTVGVIDPRTGSKVCTLTKRLSIFRSLVNRRLAAARSGVDLIADRSAAWSLLPDTSGLELQVHPHRSCRSMVVERLATKTSTPTTPMTATDAPPIAVRDGIRRSDRSRSRASRAPRRVDRPTPGPSGISRLGASGRTDTAAPAPARRRAMVSVHASSRTSMIIAPQSTTTGSIRIPAEGSTRRAIATGKRGDAATAPTAPSTVPMPSASADGSDSASARWRRVMPMARVIGTASEDSATWRSTPCPIASSPASRATPANTASAAATTSTADREVAAHSSSTDATCVPP